MRRCERAGSELKYSLGTFAAVLTLRNDDGERHDFRSPMFQGLSIRVETGGAMAKARPIFSR